MRNFGISRVLFKKWQIKANLVLKSQLVKIKKMNTDPIADYLTRIRNG